MTGAADADTPGGLLELRGDRYLGVFPKTIQAQVPATLTGPQRLIVRRRTSPTQPEPTKFTYDMVLLPA